MWNLSYSDFPTVIGNLMLWVVLPFIEKNNFRIRKIIKHYLEM